MMMRKPEWNKEGGFTAIEIVLVVAILGLLITGMFSQFQPVSRESREQETRARMERIAKALNNYVIKNGRLPCAGQVALPMGDDPPIGVEMGNYSYLCKKDKRMEGIVPFRTLGLPEDMAKDAWGNYFTYRVSPNLGVPVEAVDGWGSNEQPRGDQVHEICRIDGQWAVDPGGGYRNVNYQKAFFCCPTEGAGAGLFDVSTDLVIEDQSGNRISPPARTADPAKYDAADVAVAAATTESEIVAYTLLSHGANGHGAMIANTSPLQRVVAAGFGNNESRNIHSLDNGAPTPADVTFVDAPRNDNPNAGTGYFDDIILWKTQYDIYEEAAGQSCRTPI